MARPALDLTPEQRRERRRLQFWVASRKYRARKRGENPPKLKYDRRRDNVPIVLRFIELLIERQHARKRGNHAGQDQATLEG